MGCVAISGAISGIATGSLEEGLKAAAFAFVSAGTFDIVGAVIEGMHAIGQAVVRGVVNGALNVAQGGSFLIGMATGALGKLGGFLGQEAFGLAGTGDMNAVLGRTMFAAAAGCAGAVIAKGSCGQGAFQAGLAHLFNAEKIGQYSSNRPGWHDYTTKNEVCSVALACTQQEMKGYLLRFAVPGQDPANPVQDGGIYQVFDPRNKDFGLSIFDGIFRPSSLAGFVRTTISDDGMSIKNVTLPLHVLYDGEITRTLSSNTNGGWSVTTRGIGNNVIPGAATINQWQGPKVFNHVDRQMRSYIRRSKQ
ncbi:MAG: hypothetical protein AAF228_13570 [Pseudomonadota bacterium]